MKTKFFIATAAAVLLTLLCQAQQTEYIISEIGKCKTGVAYDVFVAGQYAYATTNKGVSIINTVDKTRPKIIRWIKTKRAVFGIRVHSDQLYFVTMDGKFNIATLQPPEKSVIIGTVSDLESPYAIDVADSYAYITQDNGKLVIFNVEYPENPKLVSSYDHSKAGRGISIRENILYVAVGSRGLLVFDVSNPAAPELKSEVPVGGSARSIDIYKDLLIVGSHTGPVNIFKISDPLAPQKISSVNDGGEAYGVSAEDDILIIADLQRGLLAYDISVPEKPLFLNKIQCAAHSVYYDGNFIYVCAETGFHIFKLQYGKIIHRHFLLRGYFFDMAGQFFFGNCYFFGFNFSIQQLFDDYFFQGLLF